MDHIELHNKWLKADGHPMPSNIECLPLHLIARAVKIRLTGALVGILPEDSEREEKQANQDSMKLWDKDSEF